MCTLRYRTTTERRSGARAANGKARNAHVIAALTATMAAMCAVSAMGASPLHQNEAADENRGVPGEGAHQHPAGRDQPGHDRADRGEHREQPVRPEPVGVDGEYDEQGR